MSMKNVKKVGMGGFMCSIPDASAVCMMTGDNGSVVVPRRQMRTSSSCACSSSTLVDHSMVMKNSNTSYSRLVEPRRTSVSLGDRRPVTLSTALKRDRQCEREGERISCRPSRPLVPPPLPVFQKVVMRVSIHCQGCAGKLKKHLSKMEGVTSFSIDLETKRVTVMGHVSPVFVLESISKVKKAELWPC